MYSKTLQNSFKSGKTEFLTSFVRWFENKSMRAVTRAAALIRKEVWLLEGLDCNTSIPYKILFVGKNEERHYIGKLFFGPNFNVRSIGRHWLWQSLRPGSRIAESCEFSIIQTHWPVHRIFRFKKIFCIPCWVYGSIELNDELDGHIRKSKSSRYNIRLMKQNRFQVETSRDISGFNEFYSEMFQPYIRNRHGECSVVDKYDKLRVRFEKDGEMLFITKGTRRIAGMMISYQNNKASAYRLGVKDGDFQWVEKGVISALYYHTIKHCRAKGYQKLHLGGSRPFLSDGVLNYKMKNWNMKIDDYARQFYFLIKPLSRSEFANNFLSKNSFISLKRNKMIANTLVTGPKQRNRIENIRARYFEKGVANINLYHLTDKNTVYQRVRT